MLNSLVGINGGPGPGGVQPEAAPSHLAEAAAVESSAAEKSFHLRVPAFEKGSLIFMKMKV